MVQTIEGLARPPGDKRLGIVASRFNSLVVDALVNGALDTFRRLGIEPGRVDVIRVPGAFEIPLAAQALALGGCRDLCIAPINESAQAARWARHQGLVLYYETGILQQDYPLRGSYLLEQWTAELAEAARNQTAQWNRRGGLVELLNRNENLWN